MKKHCLAVVCGLGLCTSAQALELGAYLGDDAGIGILHHDLRVNVGLSNFALSLDKIHSFRDNPQYFYWGYGAKYRDSNKHSFGIRGNFGIKTQVDSFVLYAEAQPIAYLLEDTAMKLEVNAGVRYRF
ncbi:hypothetical protein [Aliagarivorans taiwanensis]|uniref:hypothetical protein n=1 Tax=Aliagarivorans taiwanensis TaxID=561966 RepID=UPI000411C552|nr:hypothetical protein [Aliagarivorans taiwanensis]